MTIILTLDIKLSGWRAQRSWAVRIEVAESFTLAELHSTIQRLVRFDDDHLHEFFAGRNWRDRKVEFGEPAGTPFRGNDAEEVPLSEVFPLKKDRKLYYHFDFGDDWLFEITCHPETRQVSAKPKGVKLIHEKGRRPIQYPGEDDEG